MRGCKVSALQESPGAVAPDSSAEVPSEPEMGGRAVGMGWHGGRGVSLWIPWSLRSPETGHVFFSFFTTSLRDTPTSKMSLNPQKAVPALLPPGTELGGLGEALAVPREALVGSQLGEGPMEVSPCTGLSPGRVGPVGLAGLRAQAWGHALEPDAPVTLRGRTSLQDKALARSCVRQHALCPHGARWDSRATRGTWGLTRDI